MARCDEFGGGNLEREESYGRSMDRRNYECGIPSLALSRDLDGLCNSRCCYGFIFEVVGISQRALLDDVRMLWTGQASVYGKRA